MGAALIAPLIHAGQGTSPGQQPPGIRAGARGGPNPPAQTQDEGWIGGGPITGYRIPSINEPRYLPPNPADEAGIGRAPGAKAAHIEVDLHVFDKFYMGVGIRHPEPHEAFVASVHGQTPYDGPGEAAFGGQHEGQHPPIGSYGEAVTVPARRAGTLTRRRRG
jgi:hypothetical protein